MSFVKAVKNTPEIAACLKSGLQALGANSKKVEVKSTRDLTGSVDIDACLKSRYPNAPRWDYVFGYRDHIFYVEVHPCTTGEVKAIISKFKWLKEWRRKHSPLEACRDISTYHWVASGKVDITQRNKYIRMLANNGISTNLRPKLMADEFLGSSGRKVRDEK